MSREVAENSFDRWVSLPSHPGQRLHGLSRAHLYDLIASGKIKSANIKKPGCLTGRRLVWEASIVAYIERFAEGGEIQHDAA